jgi:hypothetical protein
VWNVTQGADTDAKDVAGTTPNQMARERGITLTPVQDLWSLRVPRPLSLRFAVERLDLKTMTTMMASSRAGVQGKGRTTPSVFPSGGGGGGGGMGGGGGGGGILGTFFRPAISCRYPALDIDLKYAHSLTPRTAHTARTDTRHTF